MSVTYISASLRRLVEERANYCCEYCLLSNSLSFFPHEQDDKIASKKIHTKYPHAKCLIMRLNETGCCGKI